jgi:polysaccharide export outer membrane protein
MRIIKLKNTALFFLVLSIILCQSCVNTKKVAYFQDLNAPQKSSLGTKAVFTEPGIQPDDILSIAIFTIDPETSAAINQVGSQTLSGVSSSTGQQQGAGGFLVDKNGEIELAMIGKIKLLGLTTFKARDLIRERAEQYYKNPSVQVRYANFKVTVLGEVARPASYTLPNEKVTVLDALGLAGDLTIYGKRENVLLIREVNDKKEYTRLNLNSSELFNSPYYYLRQNDVLYIEPTTARAAANNAARTQTIAIVGSVISVLIAIITRF